MDETTRQLVKQLPKVDAVLNWPVIAAWNASCPAQLIKEAVQAAIEGVRQEILTCRRDTMPDEAEWERAIAGAVQQRRQLHLRRLINATGTVLHTNLGRARLSERVSRHIADIASSYTNLEYDVADGRRGSRYSHVRQILRRLTGAEDALVVNNNAAAVLLALTTLIPGREVLISRGELVEIGGMFRIPDVIAQSGGTIREVGTTNKTHLADYAQAIGEQTGAIMKVHTSNYRLIGFTESVPPEELASLAHRHGLPFINDLGSGLLMDMRQFGLPYEPTVRETLQQGCDLVTFSGDKLLGGPQAGIIVGKSQYIDAMKKNQLLRALRVDKLTLAALEITLHAYSEETALADIPVLHMLAQTALQCRHKADILSALLKERCPQADVCLTPCQDMVGGGAYPEYTLPGYMVTVAVGDMPAVEAERRLRQQDMPVISRIQKHRLAFSVRTIMEEELPYIAQAVASVLEAAEET